MLLSNVVCVLPIFEISYKGLFFQGNLGRVDYVNDNEYDLFIRPDTCCPRFRCWFLFTVENVKADQVRITRILSQKIMHSILIKKQISVLIRIKVTFFKHRRD